MGHKIDENIQSIVMLIQNIEENTPKGEDIYQDTQEGKIVLMLSDHSFIRML
jgi:hypothetical protein